jgi:hypothetical protein
MYVFFLEHPKGTNKRMIVSGVVELLRGWAVIFLFLLRASL